MSGWIEWATALHEHPWPLLKWGTVLVAAFAAAVTDARSRRIPNRLTGPLFAAGLFVSILASGTNGLMDALAASVLCALPYLVLFALAGGGAGDAKLMGALGAWLGLAHGALVLLAVSLAGVLFALLHALAAGRLGEVAATVSGVGKGLFHPVFGRGSWRDLPSVMPATKGAQTMPYGVSVFSGVALAATGSWLWGL